MGSLSADAVDQNEDVETDEDADTEMLMHKQALSTVGKPLSLGALVIRRGMTLAMMLTVLAGGLVMNVILNR